MLVTNHFISEGSANHRRILRDIFTTASDRIYICVPFITDSGVSFLLDCLNESSAKELSVLTSFSPDAIKSGFFSMDAIKRLVERGRKDIHVGIRFYMSQYSRSLHAKIYGNDGQALITSANLTESALSNNEEIGYLLTGLAADAVRDHWQQLWNHASRDLSYYLLIILERKMNEDDIFPPDFPSFDDLGNQTLEFAESIFPYLPNVLHPKHLDEEKCLDLAKELKDWLMERRDSGMVAKWRQEAAEKWGIHRKFRPDDLTDFRHHHAQTRSSARFYSYAWKKIKNRNQRINLISIPSTLKGPTGFQSFPVNFLKPNSQHGLYVLPIFTYPKNIDRLFQDQADENGIYWNQYPVIDLIDRDALDNAKTILEYILKNC